MRAEKPHAQRRRMGHPRVRSFPQVALLLRASSVLGWAAGCGVRNSFAENILVGEFCFRLGIDWGWGWVEVKR